MKINIIIVIVIMLLSVAVGCTSQNKTVHEDEDNNTESIQQTINYENFYKKSSFFTNDFNWYDFSQADISELSDVTFINDELSSRKNHSITKTIFHNVIMTDKIMFYPDIRKYDYGNGQYFKIYGYLMRDEDKTARICPDKNCTHNLNEQCKHYFWSTVSINNIVVLNSCIYYVIDKSGFIETDTGDFLDYAETHYILKYDIEKGEFSKYFSLDDYPETRYSRIFSIDQYIYIANYYGNNFELKCRIFRLDTINNTACLLFDNNKEPYYPLIGLYPDGVLLAAENQLIYTDFDFSQINYIPLAEKGNVLNNMFMHKGNIYYGYYESYQQTPGLYKYNINSGENKKISDLIVNYYIDNDYIYFTEYHPTHAYKYRIDNNDNDGNDDNYEIGITTLKTNSIIYKAPLLDNGDIDFSNKEVVLKAPEGCWLGDEVTLYSGYNLYVSDGKLYCILITQGDIENFDCLYDYAVFNLNDPTAYKIIIYGARGKNSGVSYP